MFKTGDPVIEKKTGRKMTVIKVEESGMVVCEFMDAGKKHTVSFSPQSLDKVPAIDLPIIVDPTE